MTALTEAPEVPVPDSNGFPPGYFVIRSIACNRNWDVSGDSVEDGTDVILHPEKEPSLVESRRNPDANNQVFYVDTSGALCSRSSGHALDIEGNRVVLRHRRPVSLPYPNSYSHPLPRFKYSPESGQITVEFSCDPAYLPPPAPHSAWQDKVYLLTSVPKRRPRNFLDDASEFLTMNVASPISTIFGAPRISNATPEAVAQVDIDLRENEVIEEERAETEEADDSTDKDRDLRMLRLDKATQNAVGSAARNRRRWEIIQLRNADRRTGPI
ncbi:hypothetical protein K525DRAFT_256068 [Schizophyllum commune Loenen D]|nr:hypothetical protein K525DRAFT_256068 [Schizophyllum commune Loenen D]